MDFPDKDAARTWFQGLTQTTKDWNRAAMDDESFAAAEARVVAMLAEAHSDA
jgi:V/A-type H+-transporting ATPase subunit A